MRHEIKTTNAEMLNIKKTVNEQVTNFQPSIKNQMDSVTQELQEFREIRRNLPNYQMLQQGPQIHQTPQIMQQLQPNMVNHPSIQQQLSHVCTAHV